MALSAWSSARISDATAAVEASQPDYKAYHIHTALIDFPIQSKRVLVIGCNRGEDCVPFIAYGAKVTGLDVMDEIGVNFTHPDVTYVKASAEDMPLSSASFDFIFSYATFEHIPRIEMAFREIERLLAPGGKAYTAAAPLWCHRSGPHWGAAFDFYPWIHLRLPQDQILKLAHDKQKEGVIPPYLDAAQISYLLSEGAMNWRRAQDYVKSCEALHELIIEKNELLKDPFPQEHAEIIAELNQKGYDTTDLLALGHFLIARKKR
jgi:SAM-dependent methyltransferase